MGVSRWKRCPPTDTSFERVESRGGRLVATKVTKFVHSPGQGSSTPPIRVGRQMAFFFPTASWPLPTYMRTRERSSPPASVPIHSFSFLSLPIPHAPPCTSLLLSKHSPISCFDPVLFPFFSPHTGRPTSLSPPTPRPHAHSHSLTREYLSYPFPGASQLFHVPFAFFHPLT